MSVSEDIEKIVTDIFGEKVYFNVNLPKITPERISDSRKICSNNKCGNYNTSWTCPPNTGDIDECIRRLESYDNAILAYGSFKVESFDMDHLNCVVSDMQDLCRKVLVCAREKDIDMFVLCSGPCNYCDECSFLKGIDCIHPEMSIPSVSGYGIPMNDVLKTLGHESVASADSVELFGLILY